MADDTNEDSWLYGTSNPDSTTNEEERNDNNDGNVVTTSISSIELSTKAENEALAAIIEKGDYSEFMEDGNRIDDIDQSTNDAKADIEDEDDGMGQFEDAVHEMEGEENSVPQMEVINNADTTGIQQKENKGHSLDTLEEKHVDDADNDDDDSDDDDINVVIGDIKAAPTTYNIKQRSGLLSGITGQDKSKPTHQGGKFSVEDFEGVGTINGVAPHEFSIDTLEDKPWRKPGADITDYFNYGFNEETWRAYCDRQKRFRVIESGVGLAGLTQNLNLAHDRDKQFLRECDSPASNGPQPVILLPQSSSPTSSSNDNVQMPPPGLIPIPPGIPHQAPPQRFNMSRGPRPLIPVSKENLIQVMTAECREYSRVGQISSNFMGSGSVSDEPFFHESDSFDYGYEPTQELQWRNDNSNWMPSGVKELTPGPNMVPPPQLTGIMQCNQSSQMSGSQSRIGVVSPQLVNHSSQMGGPQSQMSGPPPRLGGPPMQMGGPPTQMVGPPSQMGGPPSQMGGPPSQMGAPPPQMGGPPPQMVGPPPRMQGPPPQMGGHLPQMSGHLPQMSGHLSQMGGPPPQMGGHMPHMRPPHPQGPLMPGMMGNMNMGPPTSMGMMISSVNGPPMRMPMCGVPRLMASGPPDRNDEERERRRREKDWERERDREREKFRRERSRSREKIRRRSKSREKERDKDRDRDRERDRDRDRERNEKEDNDRSEEDRDRRRRDRDRDRERDRERDRLRRDRSKSREKSRRRSKSRDKERDKDREKDRDKDRDKDRERGSKTGSSTSSSSNRNDKKKSHRKEEEELI